MSMLKLAYLNNMILFTTDDWHSLATTELEEAKKLPALPGSEMEWQKRQRLRVEAHYKNIKPIKIGYYG